MTQSKSVFLGLLAVLAFTIVATDPASAKLKVVTTSTDIAAIASAVAGGRASVESLAPGTADLHFVEAKPSMIKRATDADLLIVVGAELEIGWMPSLQQAARNDKILSGSPGYLDLSQAVDLTDVPSGPVTRAMGDVHPYGNPHYQLDPQNGLSMARAIAARLSELDAAGAPDYAAGLDAFEKQLSVKMAQWQARMAPLKGKAAISYHKSFDYLARAFGFRLVGEVEPKPGIAPTAAHLAELVETIKARNVGLLLAEPYRETRSGEFLMEKTGIRVAVVPTSVGAQPGVNSYFDLFDRITATIAGSGD